jgi:hypothetical protein
MYFYIIKNSTDLGFGITGNYESRAQDYVSHSGPRSGAYFPLVFSGYTPHVRKLEKIVKDQWIDRTYISRDGWKTEWLNEHETLQGFAQDILDVITERHLRVEIFTKDYNFLLDR